MRNALRLSALLLGIAAGCADPAVAPAGGAPSAFDPALTEAGARADVLNVSTRAVLARFSVEHPRSDRLTPVEQESRRRLEAMQVWSGLLCHDLAAIGERPAWTPGPHERLALGMSDLSMAQRLTLLRGAFEATRDQIDEDRSASPEGSWLRDGNVGGVVERIDLDLRVLENMNADITIY